MTSAADSEAGRAVVCPHADRCAGCELIGLPYTDQLDVKRKTVECAVAMYRALDGLAIEAIAAAQPIVDYRVRAKLMVAPGRKTSVDGNPDRRDEDAAPLVGLYARESRRADRAPTITVDHTVVDIPQCRVLHPLLRDAVAKLRAVLRIPPPGSEPALKPAGAGGRLSAVDLRQIESPERLEAPPGLLVTLVMEKGPPLDPACVASVVRAVRSCGPVLGVAVNYRDPRSPQVLGSFTHVLWGVALVPDRVGRVYHLATYGSFVQAHRGQAERIALLLTTHLAAQKPLDRCRVLDLYGGSGAMSLPLAAQGAAVTMIESFGPAAESAAHAARDQGFVAFDARTGDAAVIAPILAREAGRFDAVIANPPRRGISPAVRSAIAALSPLVVAYISCDAQTLARDLADFARLGYGADRLYPVDMIPLTAHVEIVALLERRPALARSVLFEDDVVVATAKRAYEGATLPSGAAKILWAPGADESGPSLAGRITSPADVSSTSGSPARAHYIAMARGIARKRGSIGAGSYQRIAVVGGHSLLRLSSDKPAWRMRRALAHIGRPVIGDERFGDSATNRHFAEKYGLDRLFLHCVRLEWSRAPDPPLTISCPVPDELVAVAGHFGSVALDAVKEVMVG